jgi:glutathione S-transferase
MKLHTMSASPNSRRVEATAAYLGLPLEIVTVDLTKGEQHNPEFEAMNPNGMIPCLVDGDFVLWESSAIMIYLAGKKPEAGLLPNNPQSNADVFRWMFWANSHFAQACGMMTYERLFKAVLQGQPADPAVVADGETRFKRFGKVLNDHLAKGQWVVGDSPTLADFSLASFMTYADKAQFPYQEFASIKSWLARLDALPAWKQSLPQMAMA